MSQESGPCMNMLCLPVPPRPPQTPNYLWGVCLCRCLQAQSPLMTPCPGRGPPLRSCGYFFHCVRPWGPALLLACLPPGWLAEGPAVTLPSQLQPSCAPLFGDLEASSQRVSLGMGRPVPGGEGSAHPLDHLGGFIERCRSGSQLDLPL